MNRERDGANAAGRVPPEDARRALVRAGRHARAACREAALSLRALLDAAALASAGVPAETHAALRGAAHWIDALARGVAPEDGADARLAQALADALDAEIARWEARASQDPDARAVLRAFLGVRELLWELGVRADAPAPDAPAEARRAARPAERPAPRRRRVERARVQG
jgi:hypothetical protein